MKKSDLYPGLSVIHIKGGKYTVQGIAEHTEINQELVLYSSWEYPEKLWARPIEMFLDGRFKPLSEDL